MRLRASFVGVAALAIALAVPLTAQASLTLLRPDPLVSGTFYGHGGLSTDGYGGSAAGSLQAQIPANSTVYKAYLYAAGTPPSGPLGNVTFAGGSVAMTVINSDGGGAASRADVTSIVAAGINATGGIYSFAVTMPSGGQGVALAVIYRNASEPNRTIAILDGGSLPTGDSATFNFASPIDPTVGGFDATLALGITFSFQGALGSHACGTGQVSQVDINGARLSSCAGSADDSVDFGGLMTVGGVGDTIDNPPNANASGGNDDELYDLVPRLTVGDTSLTVATINPSHDDYIFLAAISITARASVSTTGAPTISSIADQSIAAGTDTGPLAFTIADGETAAAALTVAASSSDQTLIPDGNIVLAGSAGSRTVTVTPAAGQTGTATITISVTDGDAHTSVSAFGVDVTVPAGPSAVADTADTDEDTVLDGTSVLANDTDPVGEGIVAALGSGPAHGTLTLATDGTFTYTPAADYHGTDSFTYTANDGVHASGPATVTITIHPVEDAAVCSGGTLELDEDTTVDGLVVCTTIESDTPAVEVTTPAALHGTVTALDPATGEFTYTPDANFNGTETVWFKATADGAPDSAKVSFVITVHPVGDDPVAVDDAADAVQSDTPVAVTIDVLANDIDVDGDQLTVSHVDVPIHGTATISANEILYTPDAGYAGTDTFQYEIAAQSGAGTQVDGDAEPISATVTVTVAPDVSGPTLQAPGQSFLRPSTATPTAAKVRFTWPAGTDVSGVAVYEAQLSTDDGPYVAVGTPSAARTVVALLTSGHVYRLHIRATDGLGNVSAWKTGPRFLMGSRQTPKFGYAKHWTIVEVGSSAGTGFRYSTAKGAKATIVLDGRSFAWVAPKNSKSGMAKVYVDGRYVATVNLHASTTSARQVVFQITFATRGSHRFTIVNQGTHGHSRVSLDSVMIIR